MPTLQNNKYNHLIIILTKNLLIIITGGNEMSGWEILIVVAILYAIVN